MGEQAGRYREARDRGGNYLAGLLRADGGFGRPERGLTDYYKVPLALLVCGKSREAGRLLDWVRRHGLAADGDFGPRPPEACAYYHTYYNSWLVVGAHRQGQFDLSRHGTDYLVRTWDAEGGGFFSSATQRSPDTPQDVWVTCGAGLAVLYAGRRDVAGGVGRWLRRLRQLQPDFPRRLLTVWSPAGGLHQSYAAEDRARFEFVPGEARDQYFFQAGIAAGFLAQLYKATGDADWLGLAQEYMRAAEAACDHHFTNYQSGKVGWAGAVLYTLTGKAVYRDLAARVGDWLVAAQAADGSWGPAEYRADYTAEMTVWLDEIHQALGP